MSDYCAACYDRLVTIREQRRLILAMGDRIAAQAEILGRNARSRRLPRLTQAELARLAELHRPPAEWYEDAYDEDVF